MDSTIFAKVKRAIEEEIIMSPELWAHIQTLGKIRHLKKNEYLLKTGQCCQQVFFLNKGSLVQTFSTQEGKEIVQCFFVDDVFPFLSEITSYYSNQESDFQIKALEKCEVIEFSKDHLEFLINNFNEFIRLIQKITARSFQNLYWFSAMRLSLSSKDFLIFLHNNHPAYVKRIPDKYIAQFMGISKEWYSKLKKRILRANP